MTHSDRDDELELFLQQRSSLKRRFADADSLEPPPELDRLVLTRAREAIQTPRSEPVFRPARWALPFSLAAVLVLSFAVVLQLRVIDVRHPQSIAVNDDAATETSSAPAAESVVADVAPPAPAAAPAREMSPPSETRSVAPEVAKIEKKRAERAEVQVTGVRERPTNLADSGAIVAQQQPGIYAFRPQSEAAVQNPPAPEPDAQPESAAPRVPEIAITERDSDEERARIASASKTTPSAPLRRTSRAPAVLASSARAETPVLDTAHRLAAPDAQHRDPEAWLKSIEQLRAEGKAAEADREWEAFRKAYPDHPQVRRAAEQTH